MNSRCQTTRLVLMLLAGSVIGVGLMFTLSACQTLGGAKAAPMEKDITFRGGPAYRQVAFDRPVHGCVSDQAAGAGDCETCHHTQPNAAGKACTQCHSRDEGQYSAKLAAFVPKLKEAMHNPDTGCRGCHDETTDDGLWDCKMCHKALSSL